ncbi:MAG: hypothetical protein H0X29_05365 [Parachlamydiaceae bacterium]|nr:hypothetical protein [Parachlamydiaceae bacterium]
MGSSLYIHELRVICHQKHIQFLSVYSKADFLRNECKLALDAKKIEQEIEENRSYNLGEAPERWLCRAFYSGEHFMSFA